jgi:DNA sulfur modification protein DndC
MMLKKVLQAQKTIQKNKPDTQIELISKDELFEIRRIWRIERQDWEDSVPKIFYEVYDDNLPWPKDDNHVFDLSQKELLSSICKEYDVPFDLLAKLLESEKQSVGMTRRAGAQKLLNTVLNQEWDSESDIITAAQERNKTYQELKLRQPLPIISV